MLQWVRNEYVNIKIEDFKREFGVVRESRLQKPELSNVMETMSVELMLPRCDCHSVQVVLDVAYCLVLRLHPN